MFYRESNHSPQLAVVVCCIILGSVALDSHAQFLRLGPFDFTAKTAVDAIYTTNVEQERPSEATAEREDYYLVWRLDLRADSQLGPRTRIAVDTGIAIEKHFVRDDLDNSGAPFGRFGVLGDMDLDPLKLSAGSRWERTSESVDEKFVPGSLPKKGRQVGTTWDNIAAAELAFRYLKLDASYGYVEDRYDDIDFFLEEQDETTLRYRIALQIAEYVSVSYEWERTETELINNPDGSTEEETETILINTDQLFGLLERPRITYSIGVQREYEDGETEGWELVHILSVEDEWQLSPVLNLAVFASYTYEQDPEDDDLALVYGLSLDHEISPRASQSFSVTRTPVDTLGSTEETDETDFRYDFQLSDLIIPDLVMNFSTGYTISDPTEGETEKVLDYLFALVHTAKLSTRLTRSIKYEYSWEDSNLEQEILDEHRVTLTFEYEL